MKETWQIWSGIFPSFASVPTTHDVHSDDIWVDKSKSTMEILAKGDLCDAEIHMFHSYPIFSAILILLEKHANIVVADIGGNLGQLGKIIELQVPRTAGRVHWIVVENERIVEEGKELGLGKGITFCTRENLVDHKRHAEVDLIHFGSVIQYFENWKDEIRFYVELCDPEFIGFSDAVVGNVNTYISLQDYYGNHQPYRFLNQDDFETYISKLDFNLEYKWPNIHNKTELYFPQSGFTKDRQIAHTFNYIFRKDQMK